jgi:hypothetical protein
VVFGWERLRTDDDENLRDRLIKGMVISVTTRTRMGTLDWLDVHSVKEQRGCQDRRAEHRCGARRHRRRHLRIAHVSPRSFREFCLRSSPFYTVVASLWRQTRETRRCTFTSESFYVSFSFYFVKDPFDLYFQRKTVSRRADDYDEKNCYSTKCC